MSNLIDTTGLKFFDAPLKTAPENEIRALNAEITSHNGFGAGTLNPYLYNKTCFLDCHDLSTQAPTGGFYLNRNDESAGAVEATKMISCGQTYSTFEFVSNVPSNPRTFGNPNTDDYAIYVELAPLSQYNTNISSFYDNVEMIGTGYKDYNNRTQAYIFSTPWEIKGKCELGVVNKLSNLTPQPTNTYNNWYYVKKMVVYNRAEGSASPRADMSKISTISKVLPCILYNCNTLYYYRYATGKKVQTFNNTFNGIIIANLTSDLSPLWQLYDWRFFNVFKRQTSTGQEIAFYQTLNEIAHKSRLGDNVKLLIPSYGDDLRSWIETSSSEYIFRIKSSNRNTNSVLAFKSIDDLKWLLADWGLIKVTDDLDIAQNMPSDLFPGYVPPDGGGNPDGGNDTGYDDNTPVTDIPSFPDNTSDTVTPTTPNISALNAASVYALNITSVKSLLSWLMTEGFTKNISELFSDKLSALDDLKLMPIDLAQHDPIHAEASTSLTLANVTNENINCYKLLPNYNCIINGGSYHYTAYWGNYNDYTSASYYLYVPYGGIVELSPSHVVNKDLELKYALDIMTGNATAIVYSNGVLVKTVPCQIGQTVPITYTNTNQRQIRNALTALNAGTSIINMAAGRTDVLSGIMNIGTSVVNTAMTNPLKIGSVGNFSSGTSLIMPQNPFLIISRIQQAIPANRQSVIGIPSNINTKISSFVGSGFVQIRATHIKTTATTDEQQQIIGLLSSGIYL